MKRGVLVSGLVLWTACGLFDGDDDPEVHASWTVMEGAPIAVSSLSFTPGGTPIAVGGSSTFGDYYLQRPSTVDGVWERAQGVPVGRFGDRVLRAGDRLYATADLQVLRLDDEAGFGWTALGNPTTANDGDSIQLLTVGPDDAVYAWTSRTVIVDGYPTTRMVVLAWRPGQSGWTDVPGGEFETAIWTALTDGQGRLVYSTHDGFYRGDAAGVSRILDCNVPEFRYCEDQISSLVSDAAGDLTFYVCPFIGTHRAIYRLPASGGAATQVADIDDAYPYCKGLQALPDGTVYLFAAVDNLTGSDAALFRLAPGGAFALVAALDSDYGHVVRDGSAVFRFGDGHFATGIDYRGL